MLPGQIPDWEDLRAKFPQLASRDLHNPSYLALNGYYKVYQTNGVIRSTINISSLSGLSYLVPVQIFNWTHKPSPYADNFEQENFYNNNNHFPKIKQLALADDLFHWETNYTYIKEHTFTDEEILYRLKVPALVFSYATQLIVNQWAEGRKAKEIRSILAQAVKPWLKQRNTGWYKPKQGWNRGNNLPYSITHRSAYFHQVSTYIEAHEDVHSKLYPYNTKATDYFGFKIGKTPIYTIPMGIELELENFNASNYAILQKTLAHHCIFKRDGSLTRGVEICSAPATLDIHKKEFKNFFDSVHTLTATQFCGLHIHVSKDKLSSTQIAKILMLMNHKKNESQITALVKRPENHYCKVIPYSWGSHLQRQATKYERINLLPEHTIEFRLFASTTSYKQFLSNLEFVQAVIDYCNSGEHTCSIKDLPNWANFKNYIWTRKYIYPTLKELI